MPETDFLAAARPRAVRARAGQPLRGRDMARRGVGPEATATSATRAPASGCGSSFGPIVVKPGQNDVLVQPVTIEKPMQDGYITRFDPDLVCATDGTVPPIEQIHLHHAHLAQRHRRVRHRPVLRGRRGEDDRPVPARLRHADQGDRPVAAALHDPQRGRRSPTGRLHHLRRRLHPAGRRPRSSASSPCTRSGSTSGRRATRCSTSSAATAATTARAPGRGGVRRVRPVGRGHPRPGRAARQARRPTGRSRTRAAQLGRIENFQGGTLIGIGGHLHPGGLTNDIDLVRDGEAQTHLHRRGRSTGTATTRPRPAAHRRRGTSR